MKHFAVDTGQPHSTVVAMALEEYLEGHGPRRVSGDTGSCGSHVRDPRSVQLRSLLGRRAATSWHAKPTTTPGSCAISREVPYIFIAERSEGSSLETERRRGRCVRASEFEGRRPSVYSRSTSGVLNILLEDPDGRALGPRAPLHAPTGKVATR